ncbi:MAG: methyl-accepting chemotaxis protein, partial [Desulfobacterales bacterium]|nr:methyl-accepting chemotaxis protein [Desulfobacterales bacterium]
MFNNLSLSKKMLGSFGLVLILLTLVMGIYRHSTSSITHNFVKLLNTEVAIDRHATTSEVYMLQARRNEKDFLIRKDNKYVQKLVKNVAGLKSEAQAIMGLAEKGGDRDSVAKASAIIGYATDYETTFKKLVIAWETRGLNHKSGLQGKFRNIAHDMEAAIGEIPEPNIIALYLYIRKNEKDYLLRNDEKYVTKTGAAVAKLLAELKNAGGRKQDIDDATACLSTYQKAFNLLVEENSKIAALTQTMRAAIHKVGPAVEDLRQRSKKASIAKFEATKANAESLSRVAITGGIVAIGLGLFLAFVITRGLVRPINKSVNLAKTMASGDFTQTLAIEQKNEIGVLAGALNNMASSLGGMFKDISSGVETLSSSSTELSKVSRQMSTNAGQTASQAETVAAGAEELSVNANSVAAAMEQAATNVGMVTSA